MTVDHSAFSGNVANGSNGGGLYWDGGTATLTIEPAAGASAPEELVQEVLTRLGQIAPVAIENLEGVEENVRFKLPEMLWDVAGSPYGRMGRPQARESERNTAAASAE